MSNFGWVCGALAAIAAIGIAARAPVSDFFAAKAITERQLTDDAAPSGEAAEAPAPDAPRSMAIKLFAAVSFSEPARPRIAFAGANKELGLRFALVADADIALRWAPFPGSDVVTVIHPGARIIVTEEVTGDWARAFDPSSGATGWASAALFTETPEAPPRKAQKKRAAARAAKIEAPSPMATPTVEAAPAVEDYQCPCR